MLLIDEANMEGETAVGTYTVRGDEFFIQGHFPGNPVVPGVILCEMMAQSACLLVAGNGRGSSGSGNGGGGFTPYFTGMDKVRFRNKVQPGDILVFRCELTAHKGAFYFIKGKGYANGSLCVSGEFSFAAMQEG
jgi:3-hydroxyacyl-[acyl-carrier-protein] dehydratase